MHTLLLRLACTKDDIRMFEQSFYLIFQMHNTLVREMKKRLRMLYRDKTYNRHRASYHNIKKALKKALLDSLKAYFEQELEYHKAKMSERVEFYGLTRYDGDKFLHSLQHQYKDYISSEQSDKEAARVYSGVEKVLYKGGRQLHYKKLREFHTISGKTNKNGMRFYIDAMCVTMNKHTIYINDRKLQAVLNDNSLPVPDDVQYRIDSLQSKVKYCELTRIMFNDGWHYYVRLYLDGPAPKRLKPGKGTAGIDPGISTMAVSTPKKVLFEELAPKSREYNERIAALQSSINASRREMNPDNYNEDGTCKKGRHKWEISKRAKKKQRQATVLYRKKAAYIRQSHNELANKLIPLADTFNLEEMNYNGLKKRSKKLERQLKPSVVHTKKGDKTIYKYKKRKNFGKSILDRAPKEFLDIFARKCDQYGLTLRILNTRKFKASQYDHNTGEYRKIPLSQRTKEVDGHIVQRDLYSSFLQQHSVKDGTHANRKTCKQDFSKFLEMQDKLVKEIHASGRHLPNFGM